MGLPQEFKDRVRCQLGDSYEDFLAEYKKERVYGLRYNPLKIEKKRLVDVLSSYQTVLEPADWAEEGFYYKSEAQPGKLALHEAGAYYIQEPSAMIAVSLLDPRPGDRVLDLCAAPGGKSTQIAGRLRGSGLLVSNEIIPDRAKILSRNIERMGIANAVVLNETPERLAERYPAFFDRIVVDAPCSGEGMFRKDVNARKEWSTRQVELCAARQREILSYAEQMLKPGGVLVYSTCTFAPMENEEMAAWFVEQYPQLTLTSIEQIWPHRQRGEGHFAAQFCKEGGLCGSMQDGEERLEEADSVCGRADMDEKKACSDEKKTGLCAEKAGYDEKKKAGYDAKKVCMVRKNAGYDERMEDYDEKKIGIGRKKAGCDGKKTGMRRRKAGCNEKKAGGKQDFIQPVMQFLTETLSQEMAEYISGQINAGRLEAFGDQLYLKPKDIGRLDGLKVLRAGLQLGGMKKNRFEPAHALARALLPGDCGRVYALTEQEASAYMRGESIACGDEKGWMALTFQGYTLGFGKASGGQIKNHYPKGLRKSL